MVDNGKRRDKIRDPNDGKRKLKDSSLDSDARYGRVGSLTNAIANAVASVSQETRKLFCRVFFDK